MTENHDYAHDKREGIPVPVSSASSLDTLHHGSMHDRFADTDIDSLLHDTLPMSSDTDQRRDKDLKGLTTTTTTMQPTRHQGVISPATRAAVPSLSASGLRIPNMMLPSNHLGVPVLPSGTPLTMPGTAGNNSIPEFLYQLTKMLTDNNRHIIEWSNGKIEVHSPHRLESEVLHKYFRHSKFASFQRQLNYFGFRKNAGKGKMAPCSYVNEATTADLSSILLIKRKTTASIAAAKEKEKRKETTDSKASAATESNTVNPVLAGILQRNKPAVVHTPATAVSAPSVAARAAPQVSSAAASYQAVAKAAVGRGIRHSFMSRASAPALTSQPVQKNSSQDSLSQLASNYQNSLNDHPAVGATTGGIDSDPTPLSQMEDSSDASGYFGRDSYLLELAMIPELDESGADGASPTDGFSFIDFPNPEVRPKS